MSASRALHRPCARCSFARTRTHAHASDRACLLCLPHATAPAPPPQVAAAYLLADMADADSLHAPYWALMPPRDAVATFYDLPPAYLPLLQNTATVCRREQQAARASSRCVDCCPHGTHAHACVHNALAAAACKRGRALGQLVLHAARCHAGDSHHQGYYRAGPAVGAHSSTAGCRTGRRRQHP